MCYVSYVSECCVPVDSSMDVVCVDVCVCVCVDEKERSSHATNKLFFVLVTVDMYLEATSCRSCSEPGTPQLPAPAPSFLGMARTCEMALLFLAREREIEKERGEAHRLV